MNYLKIASIMFFLLIVSVISVVAQSENPSFTAPVHTPSNIISTPREEVTPFTSLIDDFTKGVNELPSDNLIIKKIDSSQYVIKSLEDDLIEIGTEGYPLAQPYLKLNKWDKEVFLKVKIPFDTDGKSELIANRLKYYASKKRIEFYSRVPEKYSEEIQGKVHKFTINEYGGVEFDVILEEKPNSNVFEFPIEAKGLRFYYQPPLNPVHPTWDDRNNDGAADSFRPEIAVGSYAVYHESKQGDYTQLGGKNYRAGKAFHIYRPKIIDHNGDWVWGELDVDEKVSRLTITIDQDWLNNAVYPVIIDPIFGYDTIGLSYFYAWDDELDGYTFTSPSIASSGNSISSYHGETSGGNLKGVAVLYSNLNIVDYPNGIGDPVAVSTSADWYTSNFSTPPTYAANTNYALTFIIDFVGYPAWDSGVANQEVWDQTNSYSSPSHPTDASLGDYKISIYTTYTVPTMKLEGPLEMEGIKID